MKRFANCPHYPCKLFALERIIPYSFVEEQAGADSPSAGQMEVQGSTEENDRS
jgi:hypothetical protein